MSSKMPKQISELDEAPDQGAYERKPVENYGLSLIENMGFTKLKGIGKNNQNALKDILILKPRPKGLGLGAKPEGQTEQLTLFKVGEPVRLTTEPYEGLVGRVTLLNAKEKTIQVELNPSSSVLKKISFKSVQKLTEQEFQSALVEIQETQKTKQEKKKRIKWLLPEIVCKVVEKSSQVYLKKITVTDILSEKEFECVDINHKGQRVYLRGLREKDLQTVIPKIGDRVLILRKPHRGEKARLMERDKSKGEVVVQTEDGLQFLTLNENDVSQYVGE